MSLLAWQELLIFLHAAKSEIWISRQLLIQLFSLTCCSKSYHPHIIQHCPEVLSDQIISHFKVVCSKLAINHASRVYPPLDFSQAKNTQVDKGQSFREHLQPWRQHLKWVKCWALHVHPGHGLAIKCREAPQDNRALERSSDSPSLPVRSGLQGKGNHWAWNTFHCKAFPRTRTHRGTKCRLQLLEPPLQPSQEAVQRAGRIAGIKKLHQCRDSHYWQVICSSRV